MERKDWGNHGGSSALSDITDLLLGVRSHFLSISLLVCFLSARYGQEVYCEDWLQPYLHWCFFPILSSVITVFRLTAGNYCLTRLQPNIHTCSLCLSLLIWHTVVFGCLWRTFQVSNVCMFRIGSQTFPSLLDFEEYRMTKKRFSLTVFDIMHRMVNHSMGLMP